MDTLFFYENAQLSKDLAKDSFYGHVTSRRRFTNVNFRQYPISPTFAITIANLVRSPDPCVSLRTKAGSTVRYDIFIVIRTGKKYRTVISYRTYEIVSNRTSMIEYRTVISYQISYTRPKLPIFYWSIEYRAVKLWNNLKEHALYQNTNQNDL